MEIQIRPANDNEIEEILILKDKVQFAAYKEFIKELTPSEIAYESSPKQRAHQLLKKIKNGEIEIYVAVDENNNILGYIKTCKKENYLEILDLFIDKESQGKGIGHSLMNKVFEASIEHKNIFQYKLNVVAKNTKAIEFYHKMGFREDLGRIYNYRIGDAYRIPTIIMYKVNPQIIEKFLHSARLLLRSLIERNISIINLNPFTNSMLTSINGNYVYIKGILTPLNHLSASALANDKLMSKKVLKLCKINTPKYLCFQKGIDELNDEVKREIENFISIHTRIIAKPQNGLKSKDVFLEIRNLEEAIAAFEHIMQKNYKGVLFEEYIPGDVYRILLIDGKLIAALKREKGYVIGDGLMTIEELAVKKNNSLDQGGRNEGRISLGEKTIDIIKSQGYSSFKDVPDLHRKIFTEPDFKNLETVTEVTDLVNPNLVKKLGNFTTQIGLGLAGIDVISEDISDENKSIIIEVNKEPGIDFHHYPDYGNGIDVASKIVDAIIKKYS